MAELIGFAEAARRDNDAESALPPDRAAREQALDITRSWIVEAPAGSGKTGLLIQRYLKLLADEQVTQPEQVLAITFTEKATEEIRERVVSQLMAARGPGLSKNPFDRMTRTLAEAVLRRDAAMGWALLDRPKRLNVRTIDSVCAEIARTLPVLSGAGGIKKPVPQPMPLYHEAAQRTLMQLGGADRALSAALELVLLHRDGNLTNVERLIAEMLQWRDQWGGLIPLQGEELSDAYLDSVVRPRLERTLERVVSNGLAELTSILPSDFLIELSALASSLAEAAPHKVDISPIAVCRVKDAPGTSADELDHWRALIHLLVKKDGEWRKRFSKGDLRFETTKADVQRLTQLIDQVNHRDDFLEVLQKVVSLPPARYSDKQWPVIKALFRVLSRSLAELQLVFAERGECDFAELSLLARTALRSGSGVDALEAAQGMRYRHLLVDEMQDTSTSQYELIELLTQGWHGGGQTVFLVGDPKQSIYLFRQARVERFVETMQTGHIGELPLGVLQLTANFRSQSRLVESFNEYFSVLFPAEATAAHPEEVAFVEASAIRGSSLHGSRVEWHAEALPPGLQGDLLRSERTRLAKAEARKIRAIIEEWRARPLPVDRTKPWTIAVLVRNRNHLVRIIAAFKNDTSGARIPFRAVDIETLGERPEVLDLFALTRALLHPADRVAWLAMLHAPWCGLGLADLHTLAGGDESRFRERSMEELIAERGELLSQESRRRLTRLREVMHAAMRQRSRIGIAQWVERTWRSLGGDAYLTATGMTNARRFLELLDELEQESDGLDVHALKQRLEKLFAEPEADADAVDLMTIHRSKGLEWDVVIVPGLERGPATDKAPLLRWSELPTDGEDSAHGLLAPIAATGEDSGDLSSWLRKLQSSREAAERKRLFYVACTRAKEELHLFASPETSSRTGDPRPRPASLLNAAWPAAQRHFIAQATSSVLAMPAADEVSNAFVGAMAAESEPVAAPTLERLPLSFDARSRFKRLLHLPHREDTASERFAPFIRPDGSFEARALGNTVHAFMELLARRIGEGTHPVVLLAEVAATWDRRIGAVLRGEGLPSSTIQRLQPLVRTALENTLHDRDGLWILAAHEEAASEFGLTATEEGLRSVRLDRVFRAGEEPGAAGQSCLWIIDYKTASHSLTGVERFLEGERRKYGPQMETYARMMQATSSRGELRLALYCPLLPRLVWWRPLI